MKKQYTHPAPYSDRWLKELREALKTPGFRVKAPKEELMPSRLDYQTCTHPDDFNKGKDRCLSAKEYRNLVEARRLIELASQ